MFSRRQGLCWPYGSLPGHAWIETQPLIKKVDTDKEYAKILQRKYDNEGGILFGEQQVQSVGCNKNIKISQPLQVEKFSTVLKLINIVPTKIQIDGQFFLVTRRGATLQRKLAIWDCQLKKKSPKMKSMVHYAEDEIDTGATTKEYLSETF